MKIRRNIATTGENGSDVREQDCFPRHLSLETSPRSHTDPSIVRPSSNDAIDATVSAAAAAVVVPPESTLHEFTADSETTRSLSRNTALRPIFVRLPRFVNDKGSNRERYFPSRDQSLHGLLRTGKRFLSRQTSPISDSTRGNGTRERKRERYTWFRIYIYILFNLNGRISHGRARWRYNVYFEKGKRYNFQRDIFHRWIFRRWKIFKRGLKWKSE